MALAKKINKKYQLLPKPETKDRCTNYIFVRQHPFLMATSSTPHAIYLPPDRNTTVTTATTILQYTPSSTDWLHKLVSILAPKTSGSSRRKPHTHKTSASCVSLAIKLIPNPYVSIHDNAIPGNRPRARRERRILRISSLADWDAFHDRYAIVTPWEHPRVSDFCCSGHCGKVYGSAEIDWRRVCKHYAGIRVRPSIVEQHLGKERDRWATVIVEGKRYTSWLDDGGGMWHPFQIWQPEHVLVYAKLAESETNTRKKRLLV
jgi:hypothetical protein